MAHIKCDPLCNTFTIALCCFGIDVYRLTYHLCVALYNSKYSQISLIVCYTRYNNKIYNILQ